MVGGRALESTGYVIDSGLLAVLPVVCAICGRDTQQERFASRADCLARPRRRRQVDRADCEKDDQTNRSLAFFLSSITSRWGWSKVQAMQPRTFVLEVARRALHRYSYPMPRKTLPPFDLNAFSGSFRAESDRACAVLGAALLDSRLAIFLNAASAVPRTSCSLAAVHSVPSRPEFVWLGPWPGLPKMFASIWTRSGASATSLLTTLITSSRSPTSQFPLSAAT